MPHGVVTGLDNPAVYVPGKTYWRVELDHFTPWDCNWPYGPPPGASGPNPKGEPYWDDGGSGDSDGGDPCNGDDTDYIGSYVKRKSGVFHEDIPIAGTDMTLHYASNRVKNFGTVVSIPASGDSVPASLKSIIVKLEVAGRNFETTLQPLPNQKVEFIWDGLDYLGKTVGGAIVANISIGFVYNVYYYSARSAVAQSFAQAGSIITGVRGREDITSWKQGSVSLDHSVSLGRGIISFLGESWTLSHQHYLAPGVFDVLYKGDGTTVKDIDKSINTVVGNGVCGYSGDKGPATQAALSYPTGVAVDSSGNVYIVDLGNNRIRKVDTSGIITTVAGNGAEVYSGDGGPAIQAALNWPASVAVDNSGNIYIADSYNNRIRKVDISGIITTVAGNGAEVYSGDGGLATLAALNFPVGVTVDSSGNIYIADLGNNRIRKVDTSGIITTVAG
ncbi:MAG: hypothetical protein HY881_21730 [Deltaproteobacteria bacterium]|nr:hypothetical protein [Deltaproteobacteria bacterium]